MTDRRSSSEELLRRWLRGETTRREEAELEEAARDDAFLAEALAGYRGRPEGEHQQRMEALRDRLRAQRRSRHRALPAYWQIAAAVAVLLVGGWLFWQTRQEPQADMALATEAAQAPVEESTAALKSAPEAAFADTMNTPLMADAASERTGTDLAAQSPTGGTLPSQNTRPDPRPAEPVPPAMALREESVAVPEASEADEAANQIATYTPPPPRRPRLRRLPRPAAANRPAPPMTRRQPPDRPKPCSNKAPPFRCRPGC